MRRLVRSAYLLAGAAALLSILGGAVCRPAYAWSAAGRGVGRIPSGVGLLAGAVLGLLLGAALVVPGSAFGWEVQVGDFSRVITVSRTPAEATNTATVTFYERLAEPSGSQLAAGTYDETSTGGFFSSSAYAYPALVETGSLSVAFDPDAYLHPAGSASVLVVLPGGKAEFIAIGNYVNRVAVVDSVMVENMVPLTVSVTGTVPVSQSASLSVAGTLPVTVAGVGALSRDDVTVLVAFALLAAGILFVRALSEGAADVIS